MTDCWSNTALFTGTSHPLLAKEVCDNIGIRIGNVRIERFPDGEISLQILDNVRGRDVFVFQSVVLDPNNYLMELLIMIDALKRASAKSITAVLPYYGYCRQDRKDKPRVPITAKLVANLLENAGANRILTMDLHAGQVEGFFNVPVDNLHARSVIVEVVKDLSQNIVVVAPDIGSIKLARSYASSLNTDLATIDKCRMGPERVEIANLIGDVKGKDVLLADDMCSTAGTLVSAAKACQEKGALRIFGAVTHGIFVGPAIKKIENSPIEALIVSNTVPVTDRLRDCTKMRTVSVAPLLAQAIRCILSKESVSDLDDGKT